MSNYPRTTAISRPAMVDLKTGQTYMLRENTTTIGRSGDNDIALIAGNLVSRKHAVIRKVGLEFYLEDIGSSYGTIHNGRSVDAARKLNGGDEIWFGTSRFSVQMNEAA